MVDIFTGMKEGEVREVSIVVDGIEAWLCYKGEIHPVKYDKTLDFFSVYGMLFKTIFDIKEHFRVN